MVIYTDMAPKIDDTIDSDDGILNEADGLDVESSSGLKNKIKRDCDCRKRLEQKLEEVRLRKQTQDYDFDDLD